MAWTLTPLHGKWAYVGAYMEWLNRLGLPDLGMHGLMDGWIDGEERWSDGPTHGRIVCCAVSHGPVAACVALNPKPLSGGQADEILEIRSRNRKQPSHISIACASAGRDGACTVAGRGSAYVAKLHQNSPSKKQMVP